MSNLFILGVGVGVFGCAIADIVVPQRPKYTPTIAGALLVVVGLMLL